MNLIPSLSKATVVSKHFSLSPLQIIRYISLSRSEMSTQNSLRVAVCQLTATSDRKKNFEICKDLINIAASSQAKMVFLPECFDHVGESKAQTFELSEPLDGPLISGYRQLAAEKSIWLSLGGCHEKDISKNEEKVHNSHVVINSKGEIASVYRKIHLFDIDIPGGVRLKESDFSIPGIEIIPPVESPVGKVGLGICYDLRFPEFSLALTKAGAEILTFPSAFTQTTGMAHWEPLLRSRAIESQCYVIAAAQTGKHNPKRTSYGHAMIIDPWGCVVACCSEGTNIAFANINLDYVKKIRSEMPVWSHRRSELYGSIVAPESQLIDSEPVYKFSTIELSPDIIFYKTKFSMAFVNRKTVVPGHVLVIPIRCAKRFSDLTPAEGADLFACVQTVQTEIEKEYNASSSTISIQDGPEAGQTVPHVHVHILPRKAADFEKNDDIYEKLATHDKEENIQWRSLTDMVEEATRMKKHFRH